ncbi:MAG: Na+/H+ antiporter NhaD and related arsenite permeases [uncultured Rubrobacteraceae bacterium]|uniref:Na+/H+ antiporter NhaD and related arsenite permeases n=1 Tax=uncultured Rubrobacteraceae bacterium TaxID=349277 RepID=A0A6J4R0E3_9ACTN|nr:MAG: Na+/H+ antiporter NhaD and related arsenite permeases [uncultured Rubrobacteraceae bacterium]
MQEYFAVALFVVVLVLIALEVLNRTVAALLGAAVLISFGILDQEQAATEFVDWNTIGLLAGMMVIVAILERTGVFEYLAIKSAQWGKARPGRILILLSLVTALLSAFLDNVTTVILMVPVTFLIADALESSPMPFLLTQVMASNVGGAATLIGDPPNILIGSAANLSFLDFVFALTPVVLLTLPAVLGVLYLMFRKDLNHSKDAEETIGAMDAAASIRDPILLRKSLIVLGIVIVAFFFHGALHLEAATIALFGAAALMLYARSDVEEVLREVEWPTLLFFVGLFVLVGGLEATGFVGSIATALTNVAGGASAFTAIVVIWGSGIASGIVDNIPFTATMIPVIQDLAKAEGLSEKEVRPLWWSLALGADFGGNLTLIGASANVVAAGMSERAGQRISFVKFMFYGIPVTLVSLVVATIYVLVRYY